MQYTNHYNLNLPEGSDIVNPLVQDNPNYTAIDSALYANKVRTVGNAAEVKSGTVHAITRSDSDIDVIRFTATGDWITGDTMTVDGAPVSVYLPDGSAPLTGAYVINTEVIAAINGSRVTLYTGSGAVTSIDADDVVYDNSVSGLTATDAQAAIDELSNSQNIKYDNTVSGLSATNVKAAIDELSSGNAAHSYTVTADGIKTYKQIYNELYAMIIADNVIPGVNAVLTEGAQIFRATRVESTGGTFTRATFEQCTLGVSGTTFYYSCALVSSSSTRRGEYMAQTGAITIGDNTNNVASSGLAFTISW